LPFGIWDFGFGIWKKEKSNFDKFVKSQKINSLSFPPGSGSGMTAKSESSHFNSFWTPAFAGVTGLGLFTRPSMFGILNFGPCDLFGICDLLFGICFFRLPAFRNPIFFKSVAYFNYRKRIKNHEKTNGGSSIRWHLFRT